jgi:hypothetical protein
MKRFISILTVVLVMAFSFNAWALIVPTMYGQTDKGNMLIIKLVCTAEADGTFANTQITAAHIGWEYWRAGYYLLDAWAVNSATNDHTNAAVVTVTDESTRQLIGTGTGDTLTLSQAASGVAYLVAAKGASQRPITSKLTIAIADTGGSATVQTLYLVLGK